MKFLKILTVIITLLFVSCGEQGEPERETETVQEIPAAAPVEEEVPKAPPSPGKKIVIACEDPKTFNPVLNDSLSVDRMLRLIYQPLVALDEAMKPAPAIATAWEFSPDGLTLTLHVREGALWEDGTPISAEDVIYTLDIVAASPDTALFKKCMENITGYVAVDGKTVRITYLKPFSGALYNLTFPVIPRHHFSSQTVSSPLGSGPYKLSEFKRMKFLRLIKSDNSYVGSSNIDEIEAVILRDSDTPVYSFEQSIIDMAVTGNINWKKISTSRASVATKYPSASYEFLAINFRNPVLYNPNIRKAIAHSVPKETIIDKFYSGNIFETNTPVNPYSWLYEPNTAIYGYDIQKAKEYVNLSGIGSLGDIVLLVNTDNSERSLTAAALKDELTNLGFNVLVEATDFESYSQRLLSGDFDIAVCGFDMSLYPEYARFFGNPGGVSGEFNFISYKDDLMDAYLTLTENSVFEQAQKLAFSNMQKHFAEQLPYISIGYKATVVLQGENVYGEVHPVINNPYNNIGDLLVE